MSAKRRSYTRQFKQDAVRLVTAEGYSLAEAGRSLGINPNLLTQWRQKFAAEREAEFSGERPGQPESLDDENRRLREENRRLRLERDILKKAAAYFAKESQ